MTSILQKVLDNAFTRGENPGDLKIRARYLKVDLKKAGLVGLLPSEIKHIEQVISSGSSDAEMTYDQVAQQLETNNFTHNDKISIDEKLMQRYQTKQRQSRAKVANLHPNHAGLNELEERLVGEARRQLNRTDADAQAAVADVLNGKNDTGDDVKLVFAVITKLRSVLDKKRFRLLDAFLEMDGQGQGFVAKVGFGKGLARLGVPVTRGQLDRVFSIFDLDASGTVEFREFSRVVQAATLSRQKEKMARGLDRERARSSIAHADAALKSQIKGKTGHKSEDEEEEGKEEEDDSEDEDEGEEEKDQGQDQGGEKLVQRCRIVQNENAAESARLENGNGDIDTLPNEEDSSGIFVTKPRNKAGGNRASNKGHLCFQVSDRKYHLRKEDILTQPDSVLGQVVSQCEKLQDGEAVFLDMNPDVFELVIARYFAGAANAVASKASSKVRTIEPMDKPGVNAFTFNHMCNNLGLPPKLLHAERESLESDSKHNRSVSAEQKPKRASCCSKCRHRHNGSSQQQEQEHLQSSSVIDERRVRLHLERTISSASDGLQLQVRENESLLLDTVSGTGMLIMDIFPGDVSEVEFSKECCASDVVCFDSRAYFHVGNMEPVKLVSELPGAARYKFRVRPAAEVAAPLLDKRPLFCGSSIDMSSTHPSTSLTVSFYVLSKSACTCGAK